MRHLAKGRNLSRTSAHLTSLKRNMAAQLFAHESIMTTLAKAKELRPFVEKLITLAKRGAYHIDAASRTGGSEQKEHAIKALYVRRRLIQVFGAKPVVPVKKDAVRVIDKLLNDIGPRFQDRPGGYTRIIKRSIRRVGDAAPLALLQLLKAGERGKDKKTPAAPTVKEA